MRGAASRLLTTVPIIIGVLVVAVWAFGYHPFEFKGGIGIRDSGFFRTHATMLN